MLAKLTPFQISEHKLEGYLFKFHSNILSEERRSIYGATWKRQWFLNEEKLAFLKELGATQIECTLLKGMALLPILYPDHGSRFISDIDLLIALENLPKIESFLLKENFNEIKDKKWMGNDYKKSYKRENLVIELHLRLLFHKEFNFHPIASPNYHKIKILPPEENFVYLCGHLALQHTFHKLYWLMDLHLFLNHFDLNWVKVQKLAEEYQLNQSIRSVAWILKDVFKDSISLPNPRWPTAKLLKNPYGWRYYLLKHLLKDSLWSAITYDFFWFFSKLKRRK